MYKLQLAAGKTRPDIKAGNNRSMSVLRVDTVPVAGGVDHRSHIIPLLTFLHISQPILGILPTR